MARDADGLQQQGRLGTVSATETLAQLLREVSATVQPEGATTLAVTGMRTDQIGELAARHGLVLHELTARKASLQDALMQSTRDGVVYQPLEADAGKAA